MTEAVDALARELRLNHAPTADHSHRLATLARHVAERLALGPLEATEVELVAVLHDVGKLTIDPHLLDWEGPLDDAQRARIRRHTIAGEELLTEIAGLEHLANLVRATHEAWNGTGYPDGLRGDRIPLTARIVSAADSFDAMTSDRAYRTALPRREACRRLRSGAGAQFDPRVVDALLRVVGCGPLRRS
jgi:HD-GYP domain-containing protein (c-di-GMP phosphodiesterase class II)